MRYGLFLPIFDELADPVVLADLAVEAEAGGWDGVFYWDHVYYRPPVAAVTDPWTAMAVAASRTTRVTIGPMVTPIARRRPHVLARQVVALDRLSDGRFVLGVGLGLDRSGGELSRFREETDDRTRAAMLDEGLGLLSQLLSGENVDHDGPHYQASSVQFRPTPAQGRIPFWLAARWPNRRPLRRAARHDGVFLIDLSTPADLEEAAGFIAADRPDGGDFDIIVGCDPGTDPTPWERAGATWWLAAIEPFGTRLADVIRIVRDGPPRA
jgi:alkanesulfonate monooxygenase SsuD/methylene tetrahydromethanopterin reductase-like flavin-dependent oxidoreductase (luciferase family)